jgi:predicted nucleic acid binding AN1-type Zn finger protein
MEFPQLGQHCSVKTCNRLGKLASLLSIKHFSISLDFLPMKCDACSLILCKDHIKYDEHQCSSSYRKNVQIPICPLCNQAVPYEYRDQSPDRVVSAHIDRDCRSDPARQKREKVYANKCSISTCKQREAIRVNCEKCLKSFCLRHRFPDDHRCQGVPSTSTSNTNRTQEQNDYLLAKALQESEREEAAAAAARRNRVTVSCFYEEKEI